MTAALSKQKQTESAQLPEEQRKPTVTSSDTEQSTPDQNSERQLVETPRSFGEEQKHGSSTVDATQPTPDQVLVEPSGEDKDENNTISSVSDTKQAVFDDEAASASSNQESTKPFSQPETEQDHALPLPDTKQVEIDSAKQQVEASAQLHDEELNRAATPAVDEHSPPSVHIPIDARSTPEPIELTEQVEGSNNSPTSLFEAEQLTPDHVTSGACLDKDRDTQPEEEQNPSISQPIQHADGDQAVAGNCSQSHLAPPSDQAEVSSDGNKSTDA